MKLEKTKIKIFVADNKAIWKQLIYLYKNIPWHKLICESFMDYISHKGELTDKQVCLLINLYLDAMIMTEADKKELQRDKIRAYILGQYVRFGKIYNMTNIMLDYYHQTMDRGPLSIKQQSVLTRTWYRYRRQVQEKLQEDYVTEDLTSLFGETYVDYL